MFESRSFDCDGKSYEVRAIRVDDEIRVKAFLDGVPASPYSYSITLETAGDAVAQGFFKNPVQFMMDRAEDDIRNKVWERYRQAIHELSEGS